MVMRIIPSEAECNYRAFSNETLEKASRFIRTDGALVLEDIVDPALIFAARETFVQRYDHYLDGREHDDALEVGDRRLMITIDFEPPFDRLELFANSWLLPVLRVAFEVDFVLGGYGVVCSLPAAPTQHRHKDGGTLFPQSGLDRMLPVAAITVAIPLLEMNEIHGTTALWLGTHRDETRASAEKGDEPVVREGSCVLWDYRLLHCGTPNRGTVPRPLLYLMYCRPWFLDHVNYGRQPPLRASRRWLSTLSGENRLLLARATAQWLPEALT
jgi:ectoine hydroxylase-related dioxygenase (phytanoyl-CoA dioxygenase family)